MMMLLSLVRLVRCGPARVFFKMLQIEAKYRL